MKVELYKDIDYKRCLLVLLLNEADFMNGNWKNVKFQKIFFDIFKLLCDKELWGQLFLDETIEFGKISIS